MFNTPVLLIVFNRLDKVKKIVEVLEKIKPANLYIAADGPRDGYNEDKLKCELVRNYISNISWPCNLQTLFQPANLGCGLAPYTAISWFFDQVENGIILEDDCLPDPSFFSFCEELLIKYSLNERIFHINGSNFQGEKKRGSDSYFFSRYAHCWGWATWKRAWEYYDYKMLQYPEFEARSVLYKYYHHKGIEKFWHGIFRMMYEHPIDAWDYQWYFTIFLNDALAINPQVNLISNFGFDKDATHTFDADSEMREIKTSPILFPLIHPDKITIREDADKYTSKHMLGIKNKFFIEILGSIKKHLKATVKK